MDLLQDWFLAYVCEKYGSVKAPIFLHVMMNCVFAGADRAGSIQLDGRAANQNGGSGYRKRVFGSVVYVGIQKIEESRYAQ